MTTTTTTSEYVLPSAWAPYLVNGDASGLSPSDLASARAWLAKEGLSPAHCLTCEDYGFTWLHDATREAHGMGADCCVYTFPSKKGG